jgi:polyhydroxyalkanoate synthesis regulator phasin
MAKGKHARSQQAKYDAHAEATISELRAEVADLRRRVREATTEVERVGVYRERIRQLEADLTAGTSPEVQRLTDMVEALRQKRDEAVAELKRVRESWERFLERTGLAGVEGLEGLLEILHGPDQGITVTHGVHMSKHMTAERARAVQYARGQRKSGSAA